MNCSVHSSFARTPEEKEDMVPKQGLFWDAEEPTYQWVGLCFLQKINVKRKKVGSTRMGRISGHVVKLGERWLVFCRAI